MKVSELEGTALDYWVAKAEGAIETTWTLGIGGASTVAIVPAYELHGEIIEKSRYRPSIEWAQAGPIIEREHIGLTVLIGSDGKPPEWVKGWRARMLTIDNSRAYEGPTPLIAAMRCLVAGKFGKEVPDAGG